MSQTWIGIGIISSFIGGYWYLNRSSKKESEEITAHPSVVDSEITSNPQASVQPVEQDELSDLLVSLEEPCQQCAAVVSGLEEVTSLVQENIPVISDTPVIPDEIPTSRSNVHPGSQQFLRDELRRYTIKHGFGWTVTIQRLRQYINWVRNYTRNWGIQNSPVIQYFDEINDDPEKMLDDAFELGLIDRDDRLTNRNVRTSLDEEFAKSLERNDLLWKFHNIIPVFRQVNRKLRLHGWTNPLLVIRNFDVLNPRNLDAKFYWESIKQNPHVAIDHARKLSII